MSRVTSQSNRSASGQLPDNDEILNSSQLTVWKRVTTSFLSGAIAGAVAKTTIAPLDRTKIYFQCRPDRNYRLKNAWKFLKKTYQNEGPMSLWRGNSATMYRILPYSGIQFMANEQYKVLLGCNSKSPSGRPSVRNFIAGSLAGLSAHLITYPLDRARAVMAVTKVGEYRNLADVFRQTWANEGILSVYTGLRPTLFGAVIYSGTSFFTYEQLKSLMFTYKKSAGEDGPRLKMHHMWMCGAMAGLFGQIVSYPLDIVRRRMQTATQMGFSSNHYKGVLSTMSLVYRNEGIRRGLYKGISMNAIKGPIANGVSFAVYELVVFILRSPSTMTQAQPS